MSKPLLITCALLSLSQTAQAQQIPGGGAQIQQIPQPPASPRPEPQIQIDHSAAPLSGEADGTKVPIKTLHVIGQSLFTEADLRNAAGFTPGDFNLAEMRQMAARISAYYNSRGYVLGQAYVPAQPLTDGNLTVAVVEGRYGAVTVNNHARLKEGVAASSVAGLNSGEVVAIAPLERRLLLLSDMPGVRASSTLVPGASVGTSDLIVNIAPGRSISGDIEGDNSGNRYTGAWRLGGTINFNNPTGYGDVASLRVLTSFDGLYYGRASYQRPFGDTTVGIAFAHITYDLGKEFESLDARGNANVASLYASHPLTRSRNGNLYLVGAIDLKTFRDEIRSTSTVGRKRIGVFTIGLNGDESDSFGGGGSSVYSISGSVGTLGIRSPAEYDIDALTARSDGTYGKAQANFARVQHIAGPVSLYGSVRAQMAFANLDTSEKMELGGAYGVRAYPEGEAYGDDGYLATVEARLAVPKLAAIPGQFQLIGFVDTGGVKFAHDPWFTGPNNAHRSGYGVGANYSGLDGWGVRTSYARKLGDQEATSAPDKSGRFWVQVVKLF